MKRAIIILVVIVIAAATAAVVLLMRAPDLSQYDSLRSPRMVSLPNQKMLVVTARGDPNTVGGQAFKTLFSAFFKIKGAKMAAPRARWDGDTAGPKDAWTGAYAMPVPEATEKAPEVKVPAGMSIAVTTWGYGLSAEILHAGPYAEEAPTIQRLHAFIKENRCAIAGPHEEEYLRGPGLFGPGDPKKYYTIIRYQVRRWAPPEPKDTLGVVDTAAAVAPNLPNPS